VFSRVYDWYADCDRTVKAAGLKGRSMVLKIQRAEDGDRVLFNVSGRMDAEHLAEIQRIFELEAKDQDLVLNLKEVTLVDRDTVRFLARCESQGAKLENCPPFVREWIIGESSQ
jgi:hypothetical protein